MPWVLLVIIGATLNVAVNSGYKFVTETIGVEWTSCLVFLLGSLVLASYNLLLRHGGWTKLLNAKFMIIITAMALSLTAEVAFFIHALEIGPISLVDPLWACVYALVSLSIGMFTVRERPGLVAIAGILIYLCGAGFMGLSQYDGNISGTGNFWALLVLMGATLDVIVNFGYRTLAPKINTQVLIASVWILTSFMMGVYASVMHPLWENSAAESVIDAKSLITVFAMGLSAPIVMIMLVRALVKGPISLVDPLWACIYALGSVSVGMLAMSETPSTYALCGVGLYIIGAIFMAARKKNIRRLSPIPATAEEAA